MGLEAPMRHQQPAAQELGMHTGSCSSPMMQCAEPMQQQMLLNQQHRKQLQQQQHNAPCSSSSSRSSSCRSNSISCRRRRCIDHLHSIGALPLALLLLAVVAAVPAAAQDRKLDIQVQPLTAKSISVSFQWGLMASVNPTTVTMPYNEKRDVTWIVNATRTANIAGSVAGSVKILRYLSNTAATQWSAVGISIRQGTTIYLSTNAVCKEGNQFLAYGSSSDPLASMSAVINCAFTFGPNLGPGANAFSPGGLPPSLLGEASTNRNFELAANVTLSSGVVEQASQVQTFSFDLAPPAGSPAGVTGMLGECATVRDTFAQITMPIPVTWAAVTDGVSSSAVATGNPPAMSQRVCAPTNFAYTMTIPASTSTTVCGDFSVTGGASLSPEKSSQAEIASTAYTRSAKVTVSNCNQAAPPPGTPAASPAPGTVQPAVPAPPGTPAPAPAPGVAPPAVPPVVVPPPAVVPPPVITPAVPPPAVVPPPVVPPVITPAVPPPVVVAPGVVQPVVVPPVIQPVVVPPPAPQPVVIPPPVVPVAVPQPVAQVPQPAPTPVQPAAPAAPAPAPTPASQPASSSSSSSSSGTSSATGAAAAAPSQSTGSTSSSSSATSMSWDNSASAGSAANAGAAGAAADGGRYVAPVLPTAVPQPLMLKVVTVGGYKVSKSGYLWTARTSAEPSQLFLKPQERRSITFTVDYTRSNLASGSYVMGSITVTNPNAQVASVPGLTISVAADSSSSSGKRKSEGDNGLTFQVDCLSGQSNPKSVVPFRVLSGGSVTCTFVAPLSGASSSGDGGTLTVSIPDVVTVGASAASSVEGSSSEVTPWAFAPNAVEAMADCTRVTASVQPTDDKFQVVGPADSLSGNLVPAAGKVICSAASFNFSGEFGPIGSKQGRRCGAQAILFATVKPQNVADSGLAAAFLVRGTTVVPIDEPGCQSGGDNITASTGGGNTAVQALKVEVTELSPTSVTQYAWALKFNTKSAKESVKFSENATIKNDLEVTRSISSFTRRLSGTININNPTTQSFTILDVRVNATLDRPRSNTSSSRNSSSSSSGSGGGSGSGSSSNNSGSRSRSSSSSSSKDTSKAGGTKESQSQQPPRKASGLRRLLATLAGLPSPAASRSSSYGAAGAQAAKERASTTTWRTSAQQTGTPSGYDVINMMLGRAAMPGSGKTATPVRFAEAPSPPPSGSRSWSSSPSSAAPAAAAGSAIVSATVTCPTNSRGTSSLGPATQKKGGGTTPATVSCKFVVTMPPGATLESTGKLQVLVLASGGSSSSNSTGRLTSEASFSMKNSKPQWIGSCARVTAAAASQSLAPNPKNLLKARPIPPPSNKTSSSSSKQQHQGPSAAPDSQKVCDSSSYSYEELVGPMKNDSCGSYEVISMATVEPEQSPQGAQQSLSATSVIFQGCNITVTPSIGINSLKVINYTTFTWTVNQNVTTSKAATLTPPLPTTSSSSNTGSSGSSDRSSSGSGSNDAAAASAAAVNASATPFLSRKAAGVLVIPMGPQVTENLTIVTEITRLPGVDGALFGLEGQLLVSAPGKTPLEVTGLRVAIARPGEEQPQLVPVYCPVPSNTSASKNSSSSRSNSSADSTLTSQGPVKLPPQPGTLTCTFNFTTPSSAPGIVSGVAILPATAAAADSDSAGSRSNQRSSSSKAAANSTAAAATSPSFLGKTMSFQFGPEGQAVKQDLGDCVMAADVTGMEVTVPEDLLLPPVRGQNEIGLPQLWPNNLSGRNASVPPNPKMVTGSALPDKSQLCQSKTLNYTLQFGPFTNKTCGLDSQFFAAVRVAPTHLQPKGLTRELVIPVDVPCSTSSSSSSGSNRGNTSSTPTAFIRYPSSPSPAPRGSSSSSSRTSGSSGSIRSSSAGSSSSRRSSSSSSTRSSSGSSGRSALRSTGVPSVDDGDDTSVDVTIDG